ncbi:MAG TPA: glycosyltransferase family 9 protein, partial [Segetibacter sp.]
LEYPAGIHEIERHLQLIKKLGIAAAGNHLEFPILAKDEEEFIGSGLRVEKQQYVVIHPGSRGVSRQWNPENFAAVGDFCQANGLQVIVTGTPDEREIVQKVIANMKHTPINAAGKTSLGAVAVLIKNAAALVSNCTGVSHIASALKTKSIVLSLDGEPWRWEPLNKELHTSIDWTKTHSLSYVIDQTNALLFNKSAVN